MNKLNELNVLITGGTSGIGLKTAILLSKSVNKVIVCGRSEKNLDILSEHNIQFIKADVVKDNDIKNMTNIISQSGLKINVLINNAGTAFFKDFNSTSIEEYRHIFDINFFSVINLIKAFLPNMLQDNFGKIININSIATKKVFPFNTAYSATKLALQGLTSSLRQEIRDKNIDVIDIFPGATETQLWDENTKSEREGRMMEPEDVAEAILSILTLSLNSRMIPEEIILRPKLGDL